jgi:hypothetical protein
MEASLDCHGKLCARARAAASLVRHREADALPGADRSEWVRQEFAELLNLLQKQR